MNGWTKYFLDNTTETNIGPSGLIKDSSWSRGRFKDMCGVQITQSKYHIALKGLGNYWQSDDYEVDLQNGRTKPVVRRIQKQILETERIIHILQTPKSTMLSTINIGFNTTESLIAERLEAINLNHVGQWLTLELDIRTGNVRWYYTRNKI